MKRKLSLLFLLMMGLIFVAACDDDDDDYNPNYIPGQEVRDTFKQMFPNATQVTWGEQYDYAVANFQNNKLANTAWFSKKGVWYLTQSNIAVSSIPKAITDAIANNSKYSSLTTAAASTLERNGMTNAYLIELTGGKDVTDLYFTQDGYLFEEESVGSIGTKVTPTPVDQTITAMVDQNYKGAKIVYIDREDKQYYITLVQNGTYFQYILTGDYKWIQTEYAQSFEGLPEEVKAALKRDGYAFNDAYDTVTRLIRPQGNEQVTVYRFDMDNSTGSVTVYYSPDGVEVKG